MGCANSRHHREGLRRLSKICRESEKNAEEMVLSLQKCKEANRSLMKVLEDMQRYMEAEKTGDS